MTSFSVTPIERIWIVVVTLGVLGAGVAAFLRICGVVIALAGLAGVERGRISVITGVQQRLVGRLDFFLRRVWSEVQPERACDGLSGVAGLNDS